jgi:hypothetical protein
MMSAGPGKLQRLTLGRLLLVVAAINCAGIESAARAGEDVFTVAKYPVEARADNAVAAKDRALAEGQQAAFRSLLKRLITVTAYPRMAALKSIKAGDLVEGIRVRSERNSTTEYVATLDFSFQSKSVRDLLRREDIPFTDEAAPVLTVIPVLRAGKGATGKEAAPWSEAWKGLDLEHALTPVKIEALKSSVGSESLNALAAGDGGGMRALVAAYGSELVVLALADEEVSAKRLTVTLAGRDAVGAFTLKRVYRIDPSDRAYTRELAAVVSLGILEGRWKAIKAGAAAQAGGADMLIAVEFRGMGEWQDISRRLGATRGVEELEVAGLSARGARVTLRYAEGPERLAEELARQGLALRNSGGTWTLGLQ